MFPIFKIDGRCYNAFADGMLARAMTSRLGFKDSYFSPLRNVALKCHPNKTVAVVI